MIGGSLYPVQESYPCGFETTDEYNQEISTAVSNNNYRDLMAGYYIGWCKPEKLPVGMRLSRFNAVSRPIYEVTDENRDFLCLDINALGDPEMNVDIGYSRGEGTGYWKSWSNANAFGDTTGNIPTFVGGTDSAIGLSYVAGINNLYPEFWGVSSVRLYFKTFIYSPSPDDTYLSGTTFSVEHTLSHFDAFLAGASKITNQDGYGAIEFTGLDFEHGKAELTSTTNSNKYTVIFTGCKFFGDGMYRGQNANRTSQEINVLTHQKSIFHFGDYKMPVATEAFRNWGIIGYDGSRAPAALNSIFGTVTENNPYIGMPADLQLTAGDVYDIAHKQMNRDHQGYVIWRYDGGNNSGCDIWAYYPLEMVQDCLKFLPRATYNKNTPSYANVNFAPVVTEGNEFTGQWHTGFTSDSRFTSTLRDWQYINPEHPDPEDNGTKNTNEYDLDDPEDKPEYEPEGEGEEGGKDPEGDPDQLDPGDIVPGSLQDSGDVPFNTAIPTGPLNGFVTLYALTAAEVDALGNSMWSILRTPGSESFTEMVRNFYTFGDKLDSNYYLTNADIIDYFISLRYYPFDVSQYPGYSQTPKPVKVGSGACPLGANGRILNQNVAHIPGGSCKIPDANGFYNYEPYTSIVAYIPFCGTVELQPSQVRGKTLKLDYYVDFTTGSCTAYLKVTFGNNTFPIVTVNGSLGFDILMTSNNANTVAARTQASNNNTRINMIETLGGGITSGITGLITAGHSKGGKGQALMDAAGGVVSSIADAGMQSLKHVTNQPLLMGLSPMTSGNFSSMSSIGYIKPFIQIKYHPQFNGGTDYSMVGYVSSQKLKISDKSIDNGTFFTCINPKLDGLKCTEKEAEMIKAHLTAGCYK